MKKHDQINHGLTRMEMFEKSFQRPREYYTLSPLKQLQIDEILGLSHWFDIDGMDLTMEEKHRYINYYIDIPKIEVLIGKTLESIIVSPDKTRIIFLTTEYQEYIMYHAQDCCENVWLEDVTGDFSDIIGSPITISEKRTNKVDPILGKKPKRIKKGEIDTNEMLWTYYEIATIKGYVTLRWFGASNGNYSIDVVFKKTAEF